MQSKNIEELKPLNSKSSWVVQFNIAAIEGVIKNLTVDIPFIGDYLPSNLEYVDKNREGILNFFINNKYPVTDRGIKGIEMWAHTAAVSANECAPFLQSDKPEIESLIWCLLGWWISEDLFKKLVEGKEILEGRENVKNFMSVMRDVWTGQFPTVDDIKTDERWKNSESIQDFFPCLIAFQEAQKLLPKSIPQNKFEYFFQEFQRWLEATNFIFQTKLAYGNNPSLETYRSIRPRETGIHSFVEIVCVIAQVDIPSEIRNHFLYAVLQDLAGIASGIVNDLYSIPKDINNEYTHNYVFILAKTKNISLEVAIDMSVSYLHDLICNFEKTGNQLIKEFGHDPVVIQVYDIIRHIYNGNNTFTHWLDRYGKRVAGKAIRKV